MDHPKHFGERNTSPPRCLLRPVLSRLTETPPFTPLCSFSRPCSPLRLRSKMSSPEPTQDVVFASLNWTNSSPEEARARAIAGARGVVGKPLHAPAADATVDRIYIGEYLQEEIEVAVDFHLGKKVTDPYLFRPLYLRRSM